MSAVSVPDRDWRRELALVLDQYALAGPITSATPYGNGHINETFVVVCGGLTPPKRYILQRINHRIFKNVPALMENIQRVTGHIAAQSPRAVVLVLTKRSEVCVHDSLGNWWRLYDFVEGAHTVDHVKSPEQARIVARAFGEFSARLVSLPGGRLYETIPNFHHTRSRFEQLGEAIKADPRNRASEVKSEIAFAFAREADTDVLLGLLARGEVTECVTHNDTKINNVMLDDVDGRGVAVIDLDTVMPGLSLYDFGEMVRTAASSTVEDDPQPMRMHVQLPLFRELVGGYFETAGDVTNAVERAHLGFAGKMMAFENGMRFLADYLQGDVYYRIRHPLQNLHRCRTQFALVRSIEENADAMADIVTEAERSRA